MINLNSLLPAVKAIIYSQYQEEATEVDRLNALLKLDRVVIDVLCDALGEKSVTGCNQFFVSNLFNWYSTYVKCFEVFILSNKLVEVKHEERKAILDMLQDLENIGGVEEIINWLMGLSTSKQQVQGTELKEAVPSPAKSVKSIKSGKSSKTNSGNKHPAVK